MERSLFDCKNLSFDCKKFKKAKSTYMERSPFLYPNLYQTEKDSFPCTYSFFLSMYVVLFCTLWCSVLLSGTNLGTDMAHVFGSRELYQRKLSVCLVFYYPPKTRSHPWGAAASGSLGWWPSTDPEMQAHPYKELRPPGFLIRKRSERYRSGLRE